MGRRRQSAPAPGTSALLNIQPGVDPPPGGSGTPIGCRKRGRDATASRYNCDKAVLLDVTYAVPQAVVGMRASSADQNKI